MRTRSKLIAVAVALVALTGVQSLYACAGCGCAAKAPKPADEKKPAACCLAAKKAGTECKACAVKKAAEAKKGGQCSGGACPLK